MRIEHIVKNSDKKGALRQQLFQGLGINPDSAATDPSGPAAEVRDNDLRIVLATVLYRNGYSFREALIKVDEAYKETSLKTTRTPNIKLMPGIKDLIERAKEKSLKIGLATLDDRKNTLRDLKTLGLMNVFDAAVTVDMVKHHKPNPEMIQLLCRRLRVIPGHSAIVGDATADLIMGKNAGVALKIGICEDPAFTYRLEKYADAVITSFSEIDIV
jgi:phosphoglycolate phosphatase